MSNTDSNNLNPPKPPAPQVNFNQKEIKKWGLITISILVVTVVGFSVYSHIKIDNEAKSRKEEAARGHWVKSAIVKVAEPEKTLKLIGECRPYTQATLYAKISGYLKTIPVDKGDEVKEGQVIATIESPEADQAYIAAKADSENKSRIAQRMRILEKQQLVSPQEAEQAYANAKIAVATLQSDQTLVDYKTVRAPFDGVITARFSDPGALIQNATNAQTGALPLVMISQVNRLRIITYVDQIDAASIKIGIPAEIHIDGRGDTKLMATVSRISGELDSKTRTLLTEIDYDNKNGDIVPGGYVNVYIKVQNPASMILPSEAILISQQMQRVAVIGTDSKIHFQDIKILDNDGITARILSGVNAGDRVALNVGDDFHEGDKVRIATEDKKTEVQPTPPAATTAVGTAAPGQDVTAKPAGTGG